MSEQPALSIGDFGVAFKGFLEQAVAAAPATEPVFAARLSAHFGTSGAALPVVSEDLPGHDHVNLQRALDSYLGEPGRPYELLGVAVEHKRAMGVGLAELVVAGPAGLSGREPAREGPVDFVSLPTGDEARLACVDFGLYVVGGPAPLAVLVRTADQRFGRSGVNVEVMAPTREAAEVFLADLRGRMRRDNVYRGQVISLAAEGPMGGLEVRFHRLPSVERAAIVLPVGLLEQIEQQTTRFAALRDRLRAAGRHLKRGLLLWGPPGTGKTLVAMHLAGRMPDRTVLVLTGPAIGLIQASCRMARLLQPATVVLEDVDLIAEERTRQGTGTNALLFQLLNEMDGIGEDADVLFLLTTNRPELLEAALAARPGRVDTAIEVPLPDVECRGRLLDLYGQGLVLELARRDELLDRMEGVSASFVKELVRKAAVRAAEADPGGDQITVTDEHLEGALRDLLIDGGALTRALLGVAAGGSPRTGLLNAAGATTNIHAPRPGPCAGPEA